MQRGKKKQDFTFEIAFCEGILREDPQNSDVIELLAGYYTRTGRIDDGLALDQKLVRLQPGNATAHYNLACSLALKERKAEAVELLRAAVLKGYTDFQWMLEDPDLKSLYDFPAFASLLSEFEIPH